MKIFNLESKFWKLHYAPVESVNELQTLLKQSTLERCLEPTCGCMR